MSLPYTEADVDLLDHALVAADCPHGAIGPGHIGCTLACSRCIARKALAALAAAGRLLPPDAETRAEVRFRHKAGDHITRELDFSRGDNGDDYVTEQRLRWFGQWEAVSDGE